MEQILKGEYRHQLDNLTTSGAAVEAAGLGGDELLAGGVVVDDVLLEVDRNRIFLLGTRNLPGIRFPVLVPGFEIFQLLGYWLGSWF